LSPAKVSWLLSRRSRSRSRSACSRWRTTIQRAAAVAATVPPKAQPPHVVLVKRLPRDLGPLMRTRCDAAAW
jgi:hypothetical protein